MRKDIRIDTDVLVVGGGAAALFAAIKAKEAGAKVTLIDKGGAGYSGQSPYADGFLSIPLGETPESCVEYNTVRGEYLTNHDYALMVHQKVDERYQDMLDYGVKFFLDEDGSVRYIKKELKQGRNIQGMEHPQGLRRHAIKIGVEVIDRVMVTELLTKDGAVVGAVGMSAEDMDFYEVHAKAVILCTGASALKPNGWPAQNLTGDGDAMAYRIGASIMGKEFSDGHTGRGEFPHYLNSLKKYSEPKNPPSGNAQGAATTNGAGEAIENIGTLSLHTAYEIHQGKGPIRLPSPPDGSTAPMYESGGVSAGMALHKAEGIVPKGVLGDTEIPGLYAAGDAMATMQNGSLYCPGGALAGSCVTGAEAGTRAAQYAAELTYTDPDDSAVAEAKANIYGPLERKGGYSPKWVIEQLQNMMIPYYVTYIKKGDRLEATLSMLTFFRDHLAPMLKANDGHELRLAHEVRNMILNSEMKLTMSLARKESRGMHYREDYPFRDDKNFLCWVTVKQGEDGTMETGKIDIPKEWLPEGFDTMSYEEKYPVRILNEIMQ